MSSLVSEAKYRAHERTERLFRRVHILLAIYAKWNLLQGRFLKQVPVQSLYFTVIL